MPSGPPEWHEKWGNAGPSDSGDLNAQKYLTDRGYTLTKRYTWVLPTSDHKPTEEEDLAIGYLIYEWDFGGIQDA